ncbi:MAG: hypothetical protein GF330_06760 [Candidatus Eisenbacteria bacterium]|nr:hypothetical protein [Candidatus Eisenbacteria bacterium]
MATRATHRPSWARFGGLLLLLLGCALWVGTPAAPAAEFPGLTVGMGSGLGGLFHEESIGGAPRGSEMGRFSSGVYWVDVGYLLRSHFTCGVRTHYLRAVLRESGRIGTLDLLPLTLYLGYRHGILQERLRGFVTIGAGIASARYLPAEDLARWQAPGGGSPQISREHPTVLEIGVGADIALSEPLSLEIGLHSVFMDSFLAYEPVPAEGSGAYVPERSYEVSARHLTLSCGVRWWVELW